MLKGAWKTFLVGSFAVLFLLVLSGCDNAITRWEVTDSSHESFANDEDDDDPYWEGYWDAEDELGPEYPEDDEYMEGYKDGKES